ncbi:MAG: cytochrome b/b6 domain-containing protein [Syntrophomonadaceae bacterium]|nr:cytochrome b/b6 domain-containing protein [Syntrophomonadaceae bacterium]
MTEPKKVYRFGGGTRLAHGIHLVCFFTLMITGLLVLFAAGSEGSRIIHRIGAIVLVLAMIFALFFGQTGRDFRYWIKATFSFKKNDFAHAKNFPVEFFGGHKPFPPQGKFNGGEKLNSLLTILGLLCIIVSGFIIWFPQVFPGWVVQWGYVFHAGFALLMGAVLIAHMYLGILHPDSNQALKGMMGDGYVPARFAYEHYEEWYNEIKDEQGLVDFASEKQA